MEKWETCLMGVHYKRNIAPKQHIKIINTLCKLLQVTDNVNLMNMLHVYSWKIVTILFHIKLRIICSISF